MKSDIVQPLKQKEIKILKELSSRPEGLRVESISKFTNIPKRTIYRSLNKLKEKKLIQNIFPIWKIVNGQSSYCQSLVSSNNIF